MARYQQQGRRDLLPAKGVGKCERCGAKIEFVRHRDTLKYAPLNYDYHPDGNLYLEGDVYIVLPKEVVVKARDRGQKLRINHNAVCERKPFPPLRLVKAPKGTTPNVDELKNDETAPTPDDTNRVD